MKNRLIVGLLCAFAVGSAVAAEGTQARQAKALVRAADAVTVAEIVLPPLDMKALDAEDSITDKINGVPHRFAVAREFALDPGKAGSWSVDKQGQAYWRLWVKSSDAAHLNFGFTRFNLPPSAELVIVAADGSDLLGPYSNKDRLEHGQLWTPVLYGPSALLQLKVKADERYLVDLQLGHVGQGYRGFGVRSVQCKSGSCNTDVACLASNDPWNLPRRAVGAYTLNGRDQCTGSLVNNTRNDGRMLFATAGHCDIRSDSDAASVVVYWNYESPTCRTPGSAASGTPVTRPTTTSQGLRFLAATDAVDSAAGSTATRSDWTLIELATPPAGNNFNLYWAGWDRSAPPATCSAPADRSSTSGLCASIHHPGVDEKRITFVETPLTLGNYSNVATGLHWDAQWDPTPPFLANMQPTPTSLPPSVTEGGSSGSPLYNAQRRLVGVLSGGPSFCGATGADLRDYYGGLFHAWEGLGTATTRVKDYLDPTGSGAMSIDGFPSAAPALAVTLSAPASVDAGSVFELSATVAGASGAVSYAWDTDGDGAFERSGSSNRLRLSYPSRRTATVQVLATDASGNSGSDGRELEVRGPVISAEPEGLPLEVCGNSNGLIDPGERWKQPVRLTNTGETTLTDGAALFAKTPFLQTGNNFGYRALSGSSLLCPRNFIDIASGANAVAALTLDSIDDGHTSVINLGGNGISLYGQRYTQAVMSTNGYVSFDVSDDGDDYTADCSADFDPGTGGAQLRPLHTDLVVNASGGLRYRYFDSCPRPAEAGGAQGCHVFQWSDVGAYVSGGGSSGSAEFQAVVYAGSGEVVYQYNRADPSNGIEADIGLVDPAGADPYFLTCPSYAFGVPDEGASCIFAPDALPGWESSVRLSAPVQALGTLAPGASTTVELPFHVEPGGECASLVSVHMISAVGPGSHAFTPGQVIFSGATCAPVSGCDASIGTPPPDVPPRRGLYFNAQRPGNGLNGYFYGLGGHQQIFGGLWYTGRFADRESVWYEVTGQVDYYGGEVPLAQLTNPAAPSGFAPVRDTVGRAWVGRIDDDSLMLAWLFDDGRFGAERMDSIGLGFAPSAANHTQAWFNPAESGWGLAIESLDLGGGAPFEFFAGYLYDGAGNPRWLAGDKNSTGNGSVALKAYASQCPACAWFEAEQAEPRAAGSMSIQYDARNSATLSTDIVFPAPLSGSWTRNQLNIVPIQDPVP